MEDKVFFCEKCFDPNEEEYTISSQDAVVTCCICGIKGRRFHMTPKYVCEKVKEKLK